ncbi:MAG: hypoxanthine phosphoribosyltransferase [Elusimicrobia bacterium CG08_land_8_20_14_0_20_59_10]|nr:MAG: hypoxanthine phosphoribosyltransferase [Elusimicrobia bacterium CG08_land_8_20_14_0_20_59_10]
MHKDLEEILITKRDLEAGVKKLGEQISADYAGRCVTLIGVLKGCVLFLSDLAKNISIDTRLDFMMLSSYSGAQSTGVVRTILDLKENIEGRDVIIVEDIVDSGLTMHYMLQNLKTRRPRSLEICTLLDKPSCRKAKVPLKYSGFTIPDKFVVGYGLDYNEIYRNLPYIGVLKASVIVGQGKDPCR